MAPGQGVRVMSLSRADTCTNFEALAVRPCERHPENLENDDSNGIFIIFNQISFILNINRRNTALTDIIKY